jgi:hypothetical protein
MLGDSLTVSKPTLLLEAGGDTPLLPAFDVTREGHFLMLRSSGRHRLSLVFNWSRELARLGEDAPPE